MRLVPGKPRRASSAALCLCFMAFFLALHAANPTRPGVDPMGTSEIFEPVAARHLKMTINRSNFGQPSLDELKVFGPQNPALNLARHSEGAVATASGRMTEASTVDHKVAYVNDGVYGNDSCWVADTEQAWIRIAFAKEVEIHRIEWSRDRTGVETTRTPTDYVFEVSKDGRSWTKVADSSGRAPYREKRAGLKPIAPPIPKIQPVIRHSGASDYVVERWSAADGLPGARILAIEQTPDGRLWLGGDFGLARFDGRNFIVAHPPGLGNEHLGEVTALFVSSDGALWIGSSSGRMGRLAHGRFEEKTWHGGPIYQWAQTVDGTIWGASMSGLCRIRSDAPEAAALKATQSSRMTVVDGAGRMYYDNHGALLQRSGETILGVIESGTAHWFYAYALTKRRAGGVWIYDHAGTLRTTLPDGVATLGAELPFQPHRAGEHSILEDKRENLWFAINEDGLYRLGKDGECELFDALGASHGAGGASVLFEDRSGSVWAGTQDGGLYRINPRIVSFASLGEKTVSIVSFAGGASDNIYALDRLGRIFLLNESNPAPLELPLSRAMMSDGFGNRLCLAPLVWYEQSLQMWEKSPDGSFSNVASWRRPDDFIVSALRNRAGGMVFGLRNQLGLVDNGKLTTFPEKPGPDWKRIRCLVEGSNGVYYLASESGVLWKCDVDEAVRINAPFNASTAPVRALWTRGDDLWIGTAGAGLWRYRNKEFVSFGAEHGFPEQSIRALIEDHLGHLWVAGQTGLYRISLESLENAASNRDSSLPWTCLGNASGWNDAQVTSMGHPNAWRGNDGVLYFAATAGVAIVDPASVPSALPPPAVAIERIWIDDVERPVDAEDEPIIIPSRGPKVAFQISAPHVSDPDNVRLQCRLEGWDEAWRNANGSGMAAYSRLPKGEYRFQARAAIGNGEWSAPVGNVVLRAEAAFWKNRIFVLVVTAIALLGAFGAWSATTRRSLKLELANARHEHSVDLERARIASNIHDRLSGRLTQLGLMTREINQQIAPDVRKRIVVFVTEAARNLDEIVWAIDPSKDNVESLVAFCMNLADEFGECSSIRWHIDMPDNASGVSMTAAQRHELYLSINEAMNNVLKHSGTAEARLKIELRERTLEVIVEDYGRGFSENTAPRSSRGNGLRNIRARMARVRGKTEIDSVPNRGTRVTLTVRDIGLNP